MYYIGIDLGTSAVKLLLMDETGRIANCCGIIAISYVVENKELCKNKNQVILLKPFKK